MQKSMQNDNRLCSCNQKLFKWKSTNEILYVGHSLLIKVFQRDTTVCVLVLCEDMRPLVLKPFSVRIIGSSACKTPKEQKSIWIWTQGKAWICQRLNGKLWQWKSCCQPLSCKKHWRILVLICFSFVENFLIFRRSEIPFIKANCMLLISTFCIFKGFLLIAASCTGFLKLKYSNAATLERTEASIQASTSCTSQTIWTTWASLRESSQVCCFH